MYHGLGLLRIGSTMAVLCSCSPSDNPYKGSNLIRVVPGGHSLSVVGAKTESEARPWAIEYCNKQGLSPQFTGLSMRWRSTTAEYECSTTKAAQGGISQDL